MSEKVLAVGDEIDSWCTKCKLMLAHTIQAMTDGTIEKVVCKTCKGKHKYRPKPPKSRTKKAKKSTTKKKVTRRRKKDPAVIWEEALEGKDMSQSRTYAMDAVFATDEVLEHPTFGVGLITEVRAEGKMEVLFKDGPKLLVCNR
jgi:hypothetical protein